MQVTNGGKFQVSVNDEACHLGTVLPHHRDTITNAVTFDLDKVYVHVPRDLAFLIFELIVIYKARNQLWSCSTLLRSLHWAMQVQECMTWSQGSNINSLGSGIDKALDDFEYLLTDTETGLSKTGTSWSYSKDTRGLRLVSSFLYRVDHASPKHGIKTQ